MGYRWEATSLTGFVQMLAANLLPHGYWFYVRGVVPEGKESVAVDRKLLTKYGVDLSRQQRARRKQAGQANLHYLRWKREWILLATHGEHRFFADEAQSIRDARRDPISIGDYSLRVARGNFLQKADGALEAAVDYRHRVRVQIGREKYRELRAYFLDEACRRSVESLSRELYLLPFEPYAPVRKQLLNLVRLVNDRRKEKGLTPLDADCLRYRREIVKPFERREEGSGATSEMAA